MRRMVFFLFAAVLLFSGCVSTKTYQSAMEESEARKASLEKTARDLEEAKRANEKLKKEMEDLAAAKDGEIASLRGELESLRAGKEGLSSGLMAKETELASMKASLDGKETELASLRASLDDKTKENEYLSREVERLKVKAGEVTAEKEKELSNIKNTYDQLVKELEKEIEKGEIKITQAVDRLSVNLVEKILFDSGSAEIKPEGLGVLKRVGDILKNVTDRQVRVEGHTDNVQIGRRLKGKFPSNWELSTTRATNVVRYLQDKGGLDPALLSASGFSMYRPVAGNDTAEGKALNRRIEIVLLPLDIDRVLEELKK